MKFPERSQGGRDGRADARLRLDEARRRELDMESAHEVSKSTSGELAAAAELSVAQDKTAAREAWVAWVERDY